MAAPFKPDQIALLLKLGGALLSSLGDVIEALDRDLAMAAFFLTQFPAGTPENDAWLDVQKRSTLARERLLALQ